MMPIRSLGRASMNLRVTSRIASIRVAASPPIEKSFVSIDPETSSARMISIPLASTWVRLLPNCGRAIAMAKNARLRSRSARRNFPARAALLFPSERKTAVDEKVNAAAGPLLPRNQARSGIATNSRRNQGCAKVSAAFAGSQSRRFKLRSFHELDRFLQQPAAVGGSRVVTGELDQVAPFQEILQQRSFLRRKWRAFRQHPKKFERSLARDRQLILFPDVAPQD